MANIITDKKLIEELLTRGVETIFPEKEEFKKVLLSGKKLRIYCGFDPSAPALHIGNAILINKLGAFQKLGHEVIFLIGDFTGMIGDPTDKTAARKKMTREEVLKNSENYQKQAEAYIRFSGENPAKVKYNSEWSDKINFKDLIDIASNFTVQQMIQRDMFQERIRNEKPINLHEFLYPLAQGYDSVAMDVDVEIGGNDQMFNMLCGRDLMRTIKNREKYVLTMKLLADEKGAKMSKSEGNVVWLDDESNKMFGKIMSWPDGLIGIGFELCTNINSDEVIKIYNDIKDAKVNPRDLKLKLAFEITKINHGEKKAEEAQKYFEKVFTKKETPDIIKEVKISNGETLIDFLVKSKMAESKSDARRKIEQGGVKINGATVKDFNLVISTNDKGKTVKTGKREFRRIST